MAGQSPSCINAFQLGTDRILCHPDTATLIELSSSWEINSLQWNIGPGIQLVAFDTVLATTTSQVQVIAQGILTSPNMIVNGDFSQGNSGFSSDLLHSPFTLLPPGTYAITTNPNALQGDFKACGDHTTGSGRMFASNGSTNANRNVWCQNVPVDPGTTYTLSFWAASLTENQLAQLVFRIDGQNVSNPIGITSTECEWHNLTMNWTSGMQSSAQVCIRNLHGSNSGNDFAIDDISMVENCQVSDTILVTHIPEKISIVDTVICDNQSFVIGGQLFTGTTSTQIMVKDAFGCDSTIIVDIVQIADALQFSQPDTLNCIDSQVYIYSSLASVPGNVSYQWYNSTGSPIPGANSDSLLVGSAGNYTLEYTIVTSKGMCTYSGSVTVYDNLQNPVADAGTDGTLTCALTEYAIGGTQTSQGSGFSYSWVNLDGAPPISLSDPNTTAVAAGRYVLTVINTANGCATADTVYVTDGRRVLDAIEYATINPSCGGNNGSIEGLSVGNSVGTLLWTLKDSTGAEIPGGPLFSGLDSGIYALEVYDGEGCKVQESIVLTLDNFPTFTLSGGPEAQAGEPILLIPILSPGGLTPTGFLWTSDKFLLSCPECTTTDVNGIGEGEVRLCITFAQDCEVCETVRLVFEGSSWLYMPTAFSPNGDAINDTFRPFFRNNVVDNIQEMVIYDRWGGEHYHWINGRDGGDIPQWDGKSGGRPMDEGVYVYKVSFKLIDGSAYLAKGELFLIR